MPFDLEQLIKTGTERPVLVDVYFGVGDMKSAFDVSKNGTLAYVPSTDLRELLWVDLDGKEERVTERLDAYMYPSLPHDGTKIVYQLDRGIPSIWIYDIERDSHQPLVSTEYSSLDPVFRPPDDSQVAFQVENLVWDLHLISTNDVREEVILETDDDKFLYSFSPDGRLLVYGELDPGNEMDLWIYSFDDGQSVSFLQTQYAESHATVSPNGDLIAYQTTREGRAEIYVEDFPVPVGDGEKVSNDGGVDPKWSRDGDTLIYRSSAGMMAAAFDEGSIPGTPEVLFPDVYDPSHVRRSAYDTSLDGRLLMVKTPPVRAPREIKIFQNYSDFLTESVPTP